MLRGFYHVKPRYSPGSPAMVSERIAFMVAEDEKRGHEAALSGAWGDTQKLRAEALGLRGVSEYREETRRGWLIQDLCTGEHLLKLYEAGIEKAGFRRFFDLDGATQAALRREPPPGVEDVEEEWYERGRALEVHLTKEVKVYRPEVLSEEKLLGILPKGRRTR